LTKNSTTTIFYGINFSLKNRMNNCLNFPLFLSNDWGAPQSAVEIKAFFSANGIDASDLDGDEVGSDQEGNTQGENTSSDALVVATTPNLTVQMHQDEGFGLFSRKVDVFGVSVYAAPTVDDSKLVHAATIMAEYLDNNEDGKVDNQLVVDALINNHATLLMWGEESDLDQTDNLPNNILTQDLGGNETILEWHQNGHQGQFDASLEEVLHLITQRGFSEVYPEVFGEKVDSSIADAMDIARGGRFIEVPAQYCGIGPKPGLCSICVAD
jgi:hypothetical protein